MNFTIVFFGKRKKTSQNLPHLENENTLKKELVLEFNIWDKLNIECQSIHSLYHFWPAIASITVVWRSKITMSMLEHKDLINFSMGCTYFLFSFLNELVFQENSNCAVLSLSCQKSAFFIFATHHPCLQQQSYLVKNR